MKVVLIGGSSYVGLALSRRLARLGMESVIVSRSPEVTRILAGDDAAQLDIINYASALDLRDVAAVVNLAYVASGPVNTQRSESVAIADRAVDLAVAVGSARLIHTSTIAVFGYGLSLPAKSEPVRVRHGDAYIMGKIDTESRLLNRCRRAPVDLAIIRLGNVVGPGSPAWSARIAQRLLDRSPVGFEDGHRFSNSTYINNTVSYIVRIIQAHRDSLVEFGNFHLLAEFADVSWDTYISAFSKAIGVAPIYVSRPPPRSAQLSMSDKAIMAARSWYRSWGAQYIQRIFQVMPADLANAALPLLQASIDPSLHVTVPSLAEGDIGFLTVMASNKAVASHTLPGWEPEVTIDVACRHLQDWALQAGYAVPEWKSMEVAHVAQDII